MISEARVDPTQTNPQAWEHLSDSLKLFFSGAAVALAGSKPFWSWMGGRSAQARSRSVVEQMEAARLGMEHLLESVQKSHQGQVDDLTRLLERERENSAKGWGLYDERRKETHALRDQLTPLALELERAKWDLEQRDKEIASLNVRLMAALDDKVKGQS